MRWRNFYANCTFALASCLCFLYQPLDREEVSLNSFDWMASFLDFFYHFAARFSVKIARFWEEFALFCQHDLRLITSSSTHGEEKENLYWFSCPDFNVDIEKLVVVEKGTTRIGLNGFNFSLLLDWKQFSLIFAIRQSLSDPFFMLSVEHWNCWNFDEFRFQPF